METVQQNGHFTLFSSKFPSNVYSIHYGICTDSAGLVHNYTQGQTNLTFFKLTNFLLKNKIFTLKLV